MFSGDYKIIAVASVREISDYPKTNEVDVILSSLDIGDMSRLDLLRQSRISQPEAVRILVAEPKDIGDIQREITQAAICQIIRKPWHPTALLLMVCPALESREMARRHRYLSRALKFSNSIWDKNDGVMHPTIKENIEFDKLVFVSESIMRVCSLAQRGAVTDLPILIQGEMRRIVALVKNGEFLDIKHLSDELANIKVSAGSGTSNREYRTFAHTTQKIRTNIRRRKIT